jgi:16S rRNA (cytidine1402-2'-O)-methyltransferase
MGILYIVSTPIGNRQDITLRAVEVLFNVEVILCEDTRKTRNLLALYKTSDPIGSKFVKGWKGKLISYYEENEAKRTAQVIDWLKQGKKIALVSNAGTPLISDPGFKLVRECVRQGIEVSPIPGASALLAGLVVSGLPINNFMFLGFLPKKSGKKKHLFEELQAILSIKAMTIVFYESPYRIQKTIQLIKEYFPDSEMVIARELTKKFEELIRGTPSELLQQWQDKKIKGELVVMLG